jgi:hypothetical protein
MAQRREEDQSLEDVGRLRDVELLHARSIL